MLSAQSDLEELRRRLDTIDDRLQDLLIERLEIVSRVAAEKRVDSVPPHVPAREAQILRRLVDRWCGFGASFLGPRHARRDPLRSAPMPHKTRPVFGIWRAIITAATRR
jgi:hypothetical protein